MSNVVLRKPIVTPVDERISNLITNEATPSDEKRKLLDEYFFELKEKQEKALKQEQAAKEAAT